MPSLLFGLRRVSRIVSDVAEWNKERERLQNALVKAALDLWGHTGSAAFAVDVPGTTPKLSVAAGERFEIIGMLRE